MGELVWVKWFSGSNEWFLGMCEGMWEGENVGNMIFYKVLIDGQHYCVPPANIKKIKKPETSLEILEFAYRRLIKVHHESPNADYMLKFKKMIEVVKDGTD